jgi:two-component system chemotaxis response regulator CheY
MRILIAEDDMISRKFLLKFLTQYGECDIVVDGMEALDAYLLAIQENAPYTIICLDIMMPKVDGIKVLESIRAFEKQNKVKEEEQAKIIMLTALSDTDYVNQAFDLGAQGYAVKPIDLDKLKDVLVKLKLIELNEY